MARAPLLSLSYELLETIVVHTDSRADILKISTRLQGAQSHLDIANTGRFTSLLMVL